MFSKWKGRRHKLAIGASAAGAALVLVSMAGQAGAATPPANVNFETGTANNLIVGSGSSTDYQMMIGLDSLFNQVPGCVITSGSVSGAPSKGSQELDYSCETSTGVAGTPTAGTTLEQVPGTAYLDNPINDVATEEPPMGSSNGIAQLELGRNQAGTGIGTAFTTTNQQNVSAINYARSSRDPSGSSDVAGLNFVAYAKDGVAPLIFTEWNGVKTTFGKTVSTLNGLSTQQLKDIWNGQIYDWGQIAGVRFSAPIFVYSAQEGSGTQSTFKTFLGFDPSATTNTVNCKDPVTPGTKIVTAATKASPSLTFGNWSSTSVSYSGTPTVFPTTSTCLGPDVVFENETASIMPNAGATATPDATASAWYTANSLTATSSNNAVANSAFFYSWGKYNLQCEGTKEQTSYIDKTKGPITNVKAGTNCGTVPQNPTAKSVLTLAPVNAVAPSPTSILGSTTVFPITRFLYNIYSNGSNANLPPATAATLNYVSEVGYLCKAQTADATAEATLPASTITPDTNAKDIVDPNNGIWYHDEIFNTITANGFLPVTASASGGFGTVVDGAPISENAAANAAHTAFDLLSGADATTGGNTYLNTAAPGQTTNTSISHASDPIGYCILSDTDGNTAS
jgi:ABC-type phosphate transport system substrate-binding protein